MLSFLPTSVLAPIAATLVILNTILSCVPLVLLAGFKVIPIKPWQKFISWILIIIAENWITINTAILSLTQKIQWDVEGIDGLNHEGWYLVSCNHQSWVDIVVLQKIFNHNIPFLKFFLKQELIYVPFLGPAWWALDFPFMKRFSKSYLKKHPEMKGKDFEETKKACEKFKTIPVSVMNFAEGTRFTEEKRVKTNSPYQHLLKPKSGGMAFVLSAMGGHLKSMVDVTIVYQDDKNELWDLMSGRIKKVTIRVTERPIPEMILAGDYNNDPKFRAKFHRWISDLWYEKDEQINTLKKEAGLL